MAAEIKTTVTFGLIIGSMIAMLVFLTYAVAMEDKGYAIPTVSEQVFLSKAP